jgi:hypothetical protein
MSMEGKKKQASRRKYHYIYKTTCLVTNKYYIGMHSTDNLEDGYQGSGKRLWYSINKYGLENHQTEILEFLPSREDLRVREREIVNEQLLEDKMCMNLAIGGEGGNGSKFLTKEQLSKGAVNANKVKWSDKSFRDNMSKMKSKLNKDMHVKGLLKAPDWTGKKHSKESKQKMSEKAKLRTGAKHSQYGMRWITNGIESKKIHKDDIIPDGWKFGRKINK